MGKHSHSSGSKDIRIRWEVRSVPCSTCGAEADKHCIRANGRKRYASHKERWNYYRQTKKKE